MSRSKTAILVGTFLVIASISAIAAWPGAAQAAVVIEQASLTYLDDSPHGNTSPEAVSEDGRYVVFYTQADNVVSGDTNGAGDVFVRDRLTGTTERVSVNSAEAEGDGWSIGASASDDCRYVAFQSDSTNLVAGDTNGKLDVFVRDRTLGTTTRVSVSTGGTQGDDDSLMEAISADGRYVVFCSDATTLVAGDTNGVRDVFIRDLAGLTTTRVSVRSDATQGNGASEGADVSDDGRYVAFTSAATNLVTGDTNGVVDIFVRDMTTGGITRVSVSSSAAQANGASYSPSLSADGRYVAFDSSATGLVTGDTNGVSDVFIRDRTAGTTSRVSVTSAGLQGTGVGGALGPELSPDARYVAFESYMANLVTGDTNGYRDVFVRDRTLGTTKRVSLAYDGSQANGECAGARFSADAHFIAFDSDAENLTLIDPFGWWQAYLVRNPGTVAYTSIRGVDRFDTAIKISKAMFPGALPPGSGMVLAPGYTFQEALCGAPLAAACGGPVLLNSTSILYSNVKAELQRLAPGVVFCIGLSDAVAGAVLAALPSATVYLITGTDVYDMSRAVANALEWVRGDMSAVPAIITVGTNFPDAIGVSPLACAQIWPVILTNSSGGGALHPSAAAALADLGITQAVKVGTYATLPAGVIGLVNLSGANRYVTNSNVAIWATKSGCLGFQDVGFATGDKFPDALAAGPYLGEVYGVLLLSPLVGPVPAPISAALTAKAADVYRLTYIACIEPVIGQVKALLP